MRESVVEAYLCDQVKSAGGRCVKLSPLGWVGIPDRLVLMHRGVIAFVELKRPRGGRLSRPQVAWRQWLFDHGFWVETVKSKDEVNEFIRKATRASLADY